MGIEHGLKHNNEELGDVGLKAEERPEHGFFFSFDARTPEQAEIYNKVIEDVLSRHGSPTPHGSFAEGRGYQVGYQNWQIEHMDRKTAEEILKTIKLLAEEMYRARHS
jgi:hypothetical protein